MKGQKSFSVEVKVPEAADLSGEFNNALQVAHSILRLLEGKMAQRDMIGAQALAAMLHHQLTAVGAHGRSLITENKPSLSLKQ